MSKLTISSVVLIFIFLIVWFSDQQQKYAQKIIPLVEFSLPDRQGKIQAISLWKDKIRIINFWATWCPSCLKEIPDFIQLQKKYAPQNVQFIGIAIDNPADVEDYLSFIDINYPILLAPSEGGLIAKQLGNIVSAIPYTVIVNKKNEIIFRHPGELSKELIEKQLEILFKSPGQIKQSS
ncbi:MAG: redoxin domain-containing protein [Methyloprofundus sp.]|nr:redoxin domain-containing protein [Methyloprofundus sp.]